MLLLPFQPHTITASQDLRKVDSHSLVLKGVCDKNQILEDAEKHGAVLLRGFPRSSHPMHFSAFVQALDLTLFDSSESAAPRVKQAPYVFTANEAPPSELIPFHHEMAQCETPPDYIMFFCQRPAELGGATPLVRSRDVAEYVWRFHPAAARELEARGIRYARTLPAHDDPSSPIGRSWRTTYGSTREQAEEGLRHASVQGKWIESTEGSLLRTLSVARPFFGRDGEGRRTFFNSAIAARKGWRDARNDPRRAIVYADDGTPLSDESDRLLRDAARFMRANAWHGPWHAGDVLVIDNHQILHARERFRGPRRVLASMWAKPKRDT